MRAWSPPEFSSTQAIRTASTGGEGGIRTLGTVSRTPVFKTGAFNHSATSPELLQFYYSPNCHAYFVPFGYTRILLSSPVLNGPWLRKLIGMQMSAPDGPGFEITPTFCTYVLYIPRLCVFGLAVL